MIPSSFSLDADDASVVVAVFVGVDDADDNAQHIEIGTIGGTPSTGYAVLRGPPVCLGNGENGENGTESSPLEVPKNTKLVMLCLVQLREFADSGQIEPNASFLGFSTDGDGGGGGLLPNRAMYLLRVRYALLPQPAAAPSRRPPQIIPFGEFTFPTKLTIYDLLYPEQARQPPLLRTA